VASPAMSKTKVGIGFAALAVVLAGVIAASVTRPPNPTEEARSLMMGRWRAELAGDARAKAECIVDIGKLGLAIFTQTCPAPLTGATGNVNAVKGGALAPRHYRQGGDTGTFVFQSAAGDITGAFWVRGTWLRTRDERFGEVMWRRISADKPLAKPAPGKLG